MKVVDGVQLIAQDFSTLEEMTEIGPGVIAAGVTGTAPVGRIVIVAIAAVFDDQFSC